jgi:hypothetical protein
MRNNLLTLQAAMIGCVAVLATTSGCASKTTTIVPPAPTASTLPALPASIPPAQQEMARQEMMQSMQSGREAAMHANGSAH